MIIIIIIIGIVYVVCMWLKCWLTYDGSGFNSIFMKFAVSRFCKVVVWFSKGAKSLGPIES